MSITHRDGFPWSMSQKHLRVRPGYTVYLPPHILRQREELKAYFDGRKEPRKGEVWVTVSKHGVLDELVVCAHEYPVPSDRRCLAILGPIPWTEGEGLPDNGSGE